MFLTVAIIASSDTYSYRDLVAQSYCATKDGVGVTVTGSLEYTSAVRRDCEVNPSTTCDDICGHNSTFAAEIGARFPEVDSFSCKGALWLMLNHPILAPNPGPGQTDAGKLNMVTISYEKCDATGCGPNYCCCYAFLD